MKREDDQELWDLLGKAGAPKLSPFFARNVVRQIRQEPSWRSRVTWWFAPRRVLVAGAAAAMILAVTIAFQRPASLPRTTASVPDAVVELAPIDYQVVADLDVLLAMEEDNLWSDGDISTL